MGDHRFHIKVEFEIYGEKSTWDASLNWCDTGAGIDQEIFDFFERAHRKAYAVYCEEMFENEQIRRDLELRAKELAERDRLIAKYGATP